MSTINRKFPLTMLLCLVCALLAACANGGGAPTVEMSQSQLIGFIVPEPATEDDYLIMHGLLQTADELGASVKLYVGAAEDNAESAIDEGCGGVVIASAEADAAISRLQNAGVYVVSLFAQYDGVPAILIDEGDPGEPALYMAQRLEDEGKTEGAILICGDEAEAAKAAFDAALESHDGEGKFTASIYSGSTPSDTVGVYATDTEAADAALDIAETVNTDENTVMVVGNGLTDSTTAHFERGMYALRIKPVYEAVSQSVTRLISIMDAGTAPDNTEAYKLAPHIVTGDRIERYVEERYRALYMFEQATATPPPTVPATPTPSASPEVSD